MSWEAFDDLKFCLQTDGHTDGYTDIRIHGAVYRVAPQLKSIPFISIACLSLRPASIFHCPRGSSFIMARIFEIIPKPLDFRFSMFGLTRPLLSIRSPR